MRQESVGSMQHSAPCAVLPALGANAPAETFNGGRAFEDLKRLVAFGPRPAGSAALAAARQWMIAQLKPTGAQIEEDSFTASTPVGPIPMTNVIAKFPGTQSKVVMVAGHYDTKREEGFRFVGANDGGIKRRAAPGTGARAGPQARSDLLAGFL